jgi:hypothetical protein
MKKVLIAVWALGILLLAPSRERAAITFDGTANSCSTTAAGNPGMAGQFPMTAGAWVTFTTAPGANDMSVVGHSSGGSGGWALFASDQSNCSGTMSYLKAHVVGVCSSITLGANSTQFIAVSVTSTNVHFYKLAAGSSSPTTGDVANSTPLFSGGDNTRVGCFFTFSSTSSAFLNGTLSHVFVDNTRAWSDAEITAFARNGVGAGHKPTMYWPMWGAGAAFQPELSGGGLRDPNSNNAWNLNLGTTTLHANGGPVGEYEK